jgi:DNA-binding MarR family transcriptional regulator
MVEQIGAVIGRLQDKTNHPHPTRQLSLEYWREFNEELKKARTPEEKEAVWKRYASDQAYRKPPRRLRRGATLDPVKFRPLDRNQRARLIFLAERLDANSHQPGQHGGCLKRSGLQVLRILLFHFHNVHCGRCDPSLETIAKTAGMARSTVVEALKRLEDAGIIERIRRAQWIMQFGRKRLVQWSNAYLMNVPNQFRKEEGNFANSAKVSGSGNRPPTTAAHIVNLPPMPENVAASLARLGNTMADRFEGEMKRHEGRPS